VGSFVALFESFFVKQFSFKKSIFSADNISENQRLFGVLFLTIWGGAFILTLNAKLLGAKRIIFFQSVCILGYCIFPTNIVALTLLIAKRFIHLSLFLKILMAGFSFYWSSKCKLS